MAHWRATTGRQADNDHRLEFVTGWLLSGAALIVVAVAAWRLGFSD